MEEEFGGGECTPLQDEPEYDYNFDPTSGAVDPATVTNGDRLSEPMEQDRNSGDEDEAEAETMSQDSGPASFVGSPTVSPTHSPMGSPTQSPSRSPLYQATQSPAGLQNYSPPVSPTQSPRGGSPTQSLGGSPTQSPAASPTQSPVRSPVYQQSGNSPRGSPLSIHGSPGSPMSQHASPAGSGSAPGSPVQPATQIESPPGSPTGDGSQPGSPTGEDMGPVSPIQNDIAPGSPGEDPTLQSETEMAAPGSPNEAPTSQSEQDEEMAAPGSPMEGSRPGSPTQEGSAPGSPAGSDGERSQSPAEPKSPQSPPQSPAGSQRSRSPSPTGSERNQPASLARSRSPSPAGSAKSGSGGHRSRSGSPAGNRSRSGSPAGSARSRSGSAASARSRSGSNASARSRSASPAGSAKSGSGRSRSGSPARSRSRSGSASSRGSRSRSGSAASRSRSRSGSRGSRSRSGSAASRGSRSRSGSAASRSRSRSGSPSGGGTPPYSPHGSGRSRSASPASSRSRSRSASPAGSGSGAGSPRRIRKGSESEDDKKGSGDEKEDLVAGIFGGDSSDEEEEFEGFGEADVEATAKKKKTAVLSDDEGEGVTGQATGSQVLPEVSDDDENDEAARKSARGGDGEEFVSDFDAMMAKKKAENAKNRRKRKDFDLINDSDDLIAEMINKMKVAAEEDRGLNMSKKPAIRKLKYLPTVLGQLKKADLHSAFLDCGILSAMTEWLAPLPDKSLPNLQIRESFLKILQTFPTISAGGLKTSGIGKAVMYLYKHPKELIENRERAGKLINEWSRPLFNLTSNYKSLSKEEREQRDYEQIPKRRRTSLEAGGMTPGKDLDKSLSGEQKALRPGDPGWVYRARVPMPSNKDYVIRPKWKTDLDAEESDTVERKPTGKKGPSRYDKQVRKFAEKKKNSKLQRAVGISIEGRNMAL